MKLSSKLFIAVGLLGVLALISPMAAHADTITFSENILVGTTPGFTPITNQYAAFNLTFANTGYVNDTRLVEDTHGVATTAEPATVFFAIHVTGLSFDWASLGVPVSFTAFDALNNVISTYTHASCGNGIVACNGVATLAGTNIAYVVWGDNGGAPGFLGIDSLSFTKLSVATTPEPGTIGMLLAGMLGLGLLAGMKRLRRAPMVSAA